MYLVQVLQAFCVILTKTIISNPKKNPQKNSLFLFIHIFWVFVLFVLFVLSRKSHQSCWQMTLPIIFIQHKAYRWSPPQVPAWKTADLRGMSWLINSCHKWECFPCTDWYTPAFASFASRDVRPCTSGGAWAVWKFRRNLLKHRISLWSFDEDGLSFHVTVP